MYTVNALKKRTEDQIVILKTSQCTMHFPETPQIKVLNFEIRQPLNWLLSIHHLATSRIIFIDNYYGFLAAIRFRAGVKCVQLWHAAGAIKQFGLRDPSNAGRSKHANERFQKVYERFDHVIVGSDSMAKIFHESFGLPMESIIRTGIPRTDFFFNQSAIERAEAELKRRYPLIRTRKVILYAPTFRDESLNSAELALDFEKFHQAFSEEYVLLLRLHPAIQKTFNNPYPGFICDVSGYEDINHLLTVTDVLITDYSSIPFEFSLLRRPMVFFAYDLEDYQKSRGFWTDYETFVPGPVVTYTEELIRTIKEDNFDLEKVERFATVWNEYSVGDSSKRLIDTLYSKKQRGVT